MHVFGWLKEPMHAQGELANSERPQLEFEPGAFTLQGNSADHHTIV